MHHDDVNSSQVGAMIRQNETCMALSCYSYTIALPHAAHSDWRPWPPLMPLWRAPNAPWPGIAQGLRMAPAAYPPRISRAGAPSRILLTPLVGAVDCKCHHNPMAKRKLSSTLGDFAFCSGFMMVLTLFYCQ